MAEQVGIPLARDSRGGIYGRAAIDADPRPFDPDDLFCGGCTLPVAAVKSYPFRTPGGGEARRSAHYRRKAREDRNKEHDPGCDFDFKNLATELIHESHGTLTRGGDDYELRLPDPHRRATPLPQPFRTSGREPVARMQTTQTDRNLTPMLRTAAGIVKLLRRFDDSPEAAERFRAVYAGQRLPWNQFCRNAPDIDGLLQQLRQPKQVPIAVHGTVSEIGKAHSGNSFMLRDTSTGRANHEGYQRSVHIVIRSKIVDVFKHAEQQQHWLAYGNWKLWTPSEPESRLLEVQLWITSSQSLVCWDE
jgi:hypothetical protein